MSVFDGIFEKDVFPECLDTSKSIAKSVVCPNPDVFLPVLYYALIEAQKSDPTLAKYRLSVDIKMLPLRNHQFYWNSTVLMRCWSARSLSDELMFLDTVKRSSSVK